jgi:ATP-binding cassette subfamily F protein uup
LPRGVDLYLELRSAGDKAASSQEAPKASGAEQRASQKAIQKLERAIEKLEAEEAALQLELQTHDPLDHDGLATTAQRAQKLAQDRQSLEAKWLTESENHA